MKFAAFALVAMVATAGEGRGARLVTGGRARCGGQRLPSPRRTRTLRPRPDPTPLSCAPAPAGFASAQYTSIGDAIQNLPNTKELAAQYSTTGLAKQFADPALVATAFVPDDAVSPPPARPPARPPAPGINPASTQHVAAGWAAHVACPAARRRLPCAPEAAAP